MRAARPHGITASHAPLKMGTEGAKKRQTRGGEVCENCCISAGKWIHQPTDADGHGHETEKGPNEIDGLLAGSLLGE